MSFHHLFVIVLVLIVVSAGLAQDLVTDRPDFTESALVVPAKMIQFESGVEFSDYASVSYFAYPAVLARIGMGCNFELRLGFSGWLRERIQGHSFTFLNDLLLEAKYQITSADAQIPMALLLVSTLPTGDEEVSVERVEWGVKFAGSTDLNERIGLGANIGLLLSDSGSGQEILSLASLAAGIAMHEKLGLFIEFVAEMPENESWQPLIDGGFTCLITPVVQADFYLGKGLNANGADLILGGGFSFRFSL